MYLYKVKFNENRVNIVLKPSVLDPQGQAVANSLIGQGFE